MTDVTERLRAYYDRYASIYDNKHGVVLKGQRYNFIRYYEPFLASVVPSTGRVLELGCGTGVYTQWLTNRRLDVVSMDISPRMLALARLRCPSVQFVQGDCQDPAQALSSAGVSDGFDAVVGINTFSYYAAKESALRNYHAVLCQGGRFIIIDMNGDCPFYRLMSWMNRNEMREWLPYIKECNMATLRHMLGRAKFRLDGLQHFAFIPNGLGPSLVSALTPFDVLLERVGPARRRAMRIAVSASSI